MVSYAQQTLTSRPMPQVFGGLDGIITTFAVVAAVAGAELSSDMVTLLGVANLVRSQPSNLYCAMHLTMWCQHRDAKVSDGISMGLGDYFSEKSEKDYILQGVCPRQPAPQLDLPVPYRAYSVPRIHPTRPQSGSARPGSSRTTPRARRRR